MTYTFSLPEMAFIGLVVLLDLLLFCFIASAILGLIGEERLARWLRLDIGDDE